MTIGCFSPPSERVLCGFGNEIEIAFLSPVCVLEDLELLNKFYGQIFILKEESKILVP